MQPFWFDLEGQHAGIAERPMVGADAPLTVALTLTRGHPAADIAAEREGHRSLLGRQHQIRLLARQSLAYPSRADIQGLVRDRRHFQGQGSTILSKGLVQMLSPSVPSARGRWPGLFSVEFQPAS